MSASVWIDTAHGLRALSHAEARQLAAALRERSAGLAEANELLAEIDSVTGNADPLSAAVKLERTFEEDDPTPLKLSDLEREAVYIELRAWRFEALESGAEFGDRLEALSSALRDEVSENGEFPPV